MTIMTITIELFEVTFAGFSLVLFLTIPKLPTVIYVNKYFNFSVF